VIRRGYAYFAVLACAAVLCLPSLGQASSGGGGMSGSGGSSGSAGTSAQPANSPVSASGNGVTITTRAGALLRNGLRFTGSAPSSDAGKLIEIERFGAKTNWTWQPTAQARVGSNGSFAAVWRTNHIGRFSIRAVIQEPGGTAASASGGWPAVTVVVYRPSIATLYGPGFYGQKTACGVTLRRNTIGVANRTLPCGTPVAIEYNGQTITVPVIDRGPYANHADWDLTMTTGQALGMNTTATIGAVSLPRRG
jgi:rare lipoprotein A